MLKEVLNIKVNNDIETIEQLRRTDKPIFIYGAGIMARMVYEQFNKCGIKNIRLVVDDKSKAAVDPVLSQMEILESRDLDAGYKNYIIIVGFYAALYDVGKFTKQFKQAAEIKTFVTAALGSMEELTPDYFQAHYDEFEAVCRMLADEESRICMRAYLQAKISADNRDLLPHLSPGLQYFSENFLKLSDHEYYVDCGAYDGDSLRDFLEATGGRYSHIWAMEPDPASFKLMSSFVADRALPNVTVIEAGVSSEKVRVPFVMSHDLAARVEEGAESFVDCDTIANISQGQEVSFIKMDIEGSELAALKGAEQVIRKYKPNMAVSAYHRADDFLVLPSFLRELVPEYRFYVRLYSALPNEAVLFATVR